MFAMTVEDVFVVKGRGVVATGRIQNGSVQVGDEVTVNGGVTLRVEAIEAFRKKITVATAAASPGSALLDASTRASLPLCALLKWLTTVRCPSACSASTLTRTAPSSLPSAA